MFVKNDKLEQGSFLSDLLVQLPKAIQIHPRSGMNIHSYLWSD